MQARGERGATQVANAVAEGAEPSSAPRSQPMQPGLPTDPNLNVARLAGENAELRARLADAQADRDRWHASATGAIERYNHDMQEMRGLLGREQVIALGATAASTMQDMPQERDTATLRGDQPEVVSETMPTVSAPPWWRRVFGGE